VDVLYALCFIRPLSLALAVGDAAPPPVVEPADEVDARVTAGMIVSTCRNAARAPVETVARAVMGSTNRPPAGVCKPRLLDVGGPGAALITG
jgi:hypothetical protein